MRPEDTQLTLTKFIKADRKRVFEAFQNPALVKDWIAPGALTVPSIDWNLRLGGAYSIVMKGTGPSGAAFDGEVIGTFEKIVPNEVLRFTWEWQDEAMIAKSGSSTLITVEFKDVSGGTEVTLTHSRFANVEGRNGHQMGWTNCMEKLVRTLEK